MLDYHAHFAVLRGLRAALPVMSAAHPFASKVADLCATADAEPDAAALGAFTDLVVDHAASDGGELQLLETAADLWTRSLALYEELVLARQELEGVLLQPTAPNAVQQAQTAMGRLNGLRANGMQISAEVEGLHALISPLPHLTPHGRQADEPSKDWSWRDAFLGRRTDAFVRGVFENARTPRASAFAFGVLSSYCGNVAGSAYLGSVVGGPRRTHRYRDRLARNAVGSSLQSQFHTPGVGDLATRIGFVNAGGAYAFPADLAEVLQKATAAAWPGRTPPDWNLGLRRTVRHLQLLDMFQRPPLPAPPPLELAQGGEQGGMLTILSGEGDPNVPTVGIGLDPDMTPSDPSGADSKGKSGGGCLAILLIIITLAIALLIYCIGKWTTDEKCSVDEFISDIQGSEEPDPRAPTSISQQELTSMANPEAAGHLVQELFAVQMVLWQGFDSAAAFLAVTGLIYPDEHLMPSPLYQQFLTTPAASAWPHRAEAVPDESYHLYPTSPIEQPAAADPPFPANQPPFSFAVHWSHDQQRSAADTGHDLLGQILGGDQDSQNYDLDADRGYRHPCWDVAPGSSIADPVLAVDILPYEAE
jgi:hypothetical protein